MNTAVAGLLAALLLTSGGPGPSLTLAFGGDINLARGAPGDFLALTGLLKADAAVANLESPLTTQPKATAGIDLRASPARASVLRTFTHLSTENNHTLDGGLAGKQQNLAVLRAAQITPISRELRLTSVRGTKVAWIAFLDDGVTPPPLAAVRAGAKRAQLVVVLPHWGAEYQPVPTLRQRELARELAAAGAHLIVGSGPHVLQGHERLGKALVLYSPGNLLFDQALPAAQLGAVVRVQVSKGELTACAIPTLSRGGRTKQAAGEERARALQRLNLAPCPVAP